MASLDQQKRAKLPDSAFAYVDSKHNRRLPINDESHVRNALARFNQVRFEDEAARERARKRLLAAAKKYGIVPVGFFAGQLRVQGSQASAGRLVLELGRVESLLALQERLRSELRDPTLEAFEWSASFDGYLGADGRPGVMPAAGTGRAVTLVDRRGRPMTALVHEPATLRDPELLEAVTSAVRMAMENRHLQATVDADARDARSLPSGPVTLLMTDIEDSTGLLDRLDEGYGRLLADVRGVQRSAVRHQGGREIDARADEYFAVFVDPWAAVAAALAIARRLRDRSWPDGLLVRVRIGLHHGRPQLTDTGYVGIAVHTTARVSAVGHGGQIVISRVAREALEVARLVADAPRIRRPRVRFRALGRYQLAGLHRPEALYQLVATGLTADFPPLRATLVAGAEATDSSV
jgi:class 3 adenylate cyclase